jgi:hypothetical protein
MDAMRVERIHEISHWHRKSDKARLKKVTRFGLLLTMGVWNY